MALVVAGLESLRLAPDAGGVAAFVSCLGLVSPLALGLGLGVGAFASLTTLPLGAAFSALAALDRRAPAQIRSFVAHSVLLAAGFGLWLVLAAAIAVAGLESGGSLGPYALALVFTLSLALGVALRLAPLLAAKLHVTRASPWLVLVLSVAWIWALARLGTPSGAGGTFALFGVLRRDELDLALPLDVLLLLGAAYQLPALLRRVPGWALAAVPVASLGCTWFAGRLLDEPTLALATERRASAEATATTPKLTSILPRTRSRATA
jgi:hypothetical protein